MAWTDTFTAGALSEMGFSGEQIDAWSKEDEGTVSGGSLNSPGWASVIEKALGAGATLGASALGQKKKTTTSSSTLLIIGGAVLLVIALIGGVFMLKKS